MYILPRPRVNRVEQINLALIFFAATAFPFSVAATNVALGIAIAIGLLSGQLIKGGALLWQKQRNLCLALLAYLALVILGLIWSHDRTWGMHVISRQWYWLLIPLVAVALAKQQHRRIFLILLSIGLAAHLIFCLGQFLELIDFAKDGSSASDPTGHIGHIGFGFIYGCWAAWLLHWGYLQSNGKRYGAWLLAVFAVLMVFMAEGRSGYIIAAFLPLIVIWKLLRIRTTLKILIAASVFSLLLATLIFGPGKERVQWTIKSMQSMQQGNFKHAEQRWSLWFTAIKVWESHPLAGVGTGGYPGAVAAVKASHPELFLESITPAHPHNMYLLALSRWGPLGVLLLLGLLILWTRTGWPLDWQRTDTASLIAMPALALAIHGLSAPSLEEHFPGIFAALLLGAGLAALQNTEQLLNPDYS
ncbi:MAG: O-antigen ligase family protein [Mariprofundaceae bacterium]|nr:O-antigen ligase family protein [Mariprofundaceae bacterium]